nr:DUF1799 domain-containing protein [Pseudomonas rhizoryzae]
MAGLGFLPEDIGEDVIEIWAANEQSFAVFEGMMTQWRTGMGGPTGFDYSVVPLVMDMVGVRGKKRRREVFRDIRVMEKQALKTMAENRES